MQRPSSPAVTSPALCHPPLSVCAGTCPKNPENPSDRPLVSIDAVYLACAASSVWVSRIRRHGLGIQSGERTALTSSGGSALAGEQRQWLRQPPSRVWCGTTAAQPTGIRVPWASPCLGCCLGCPRCPVGSHVLALWCLCGLSVCPSATPFHADAQSHETEEATCLPRHCNRFRHALRPSDQTQRIDSPTL